MKPNRSIKLIMALSMLAVLFNCSRQEGVIPEPGDGNNDNDFTITNNAAQLNARVVKKDARVRIRSLSNRGTILSNGIVLRLINEVAAPSVNGQRVMATAVSHVNGQMVVSYNTAGSDYAGAVVLMNLAGNELVITSQVTFTHADISHAVVDNGNLYITGANIEQDKPAWVARFGAANGKILPEGFRETSTGGHVGTSLSANPASVYVVAGAGSGNGSGLFELNPYDLSEINYHEYNDPRWVKVTQDRVYIQNGSPGNMIAMQNGQELFSFNYKSPEPESKASFDIKDNEIYIAAGRNGVQIHGLDDGSFKAEISLPEEASADLNTNSVAVFEDLIFISNGEGVYVAQFEAGTQSPELLGKLDLGDYESVNHIEIVENKLIVASGLGGVKVIELIRNDQAVEMLPRDNWSAVCTSCGLYDRIPLPEILDDNTNTSYPWGSYLDPSRQLGIEVSLAGVYQVSEFRYQTRTDLDYGLVKDFDLYASMDGINWGEPFFSGEFADTKEEQTVSFSPVKAAYIRFVAKNAIDGGISIQVAQIKMAGISVKDDPFGLLNKQDWTVTYVDSEEPPRWRKENAIDDDVNTFFYTEFKDSKPFPPHEIQIDLGSSRQLREFRYLTRQDASTVGTVGKYEVYISDDPDNWGAPVAKGTFSKGKALKSVVFPLVKGRYLRFVELADIFDRYPMAVAELYMLGQ